MASLGLKLGLYWLVALIMAAKNIGVLPQEVPALATMLAAFISHIWFMYVVYSDAKMKGVSENWWIAIFFLGPTGGLIYYILKR